MGTHARTGRLATRRSDRARPPRDARERLSVALGDTLPADLAIKILPSPDGSSAFLVGVFAGATVRLPRGEFELRFTFDHAIGGLPKLRPSAAVGRTPEIVTLRFIQPFGQDWPPPSAGVFIPNDLIQLLLDDWKLIRESGWMHYTTANVPPR